MIRMLVILLAVLVAGAAMLTGCGGPKKSSAGAESDKVPGINAPIKPAQTLPASTQNIGAKISPTGAFRVFSIYADAASPDNHYAATGWMGDFGDLKINEKSSVNPHSGTTCFEVIYSNKASQGARWAGIYWQNPPNNWGTKPGGYNLTGAKKLTFWARGAKGGERIEELKIGGIAGQYPDSDVAGIGPAVLTDQWQQFEIDLQGKDLSSISGGFSWATNLDANPDGATFYLDDIKFE